MSKFTNFSKNGPFVNWKQEEEDSGAYFLLKVENASFFMLKDWSSKTSFSAKWHIYWNARSGAKVFFDNREYKLGPGNAYLIPAHTRFSCGLERPTPHFYIDFTVDSHVINVRPDIYKMSALFIKKNLAGFVNAKNGFERRQALYRITWHYLSEIPPEKFLPENESSLDSRIAKAMEIMENEFSARIQIHDIAKRVNMSLNNFYLLFERETKKSPKLFLTELRIQRANFLLRHTDMTIEAIALETGFADRYHFSKRFKLHSRYTPVQYRLHYQNGGTSKNDP